MNEATPADDTKEKKGKTEEGNECKRMQNADDEDGNENEGIQKGRKEKGRVNTS